jgi:ABC-type antimicrobial peptide transport system permease subunit
VKFIETLKLAVAAIWAHKLRSALTLLGMIVGVTAFVVVVSFHSKTSRTLTQSPPRNVATRNSRSRITNTCNNALS